MEERRSHNRFAVKSGIFAIIGGKPYKILDIGVGGASFQCPDNQLLHRDYQDMEILIMDGNIHYIQDIKHFFPQVPSALTETEGYEGSSRVSVAFQQLTTRQSAQFQMLLGVS